VAEETAIGSGKKGQRKERIIMEVKLQDVQKLREKTKCGVMDCRQALAESGGDMVKAEKWLKEKGIRSAAKRAERETAEGVLETYSHQNGRIVAVVELVCETDFVAKNEEFTRLAHEVAMQVAAMSPKNIDELSGQQWIKDDKTTIDELVKETAGKIGENVKIRRIARFEMGENI